MLPPSLSMRHSAGLIAIIRMSYGGAIKLDSGVGLHFCPLPSLLDQKISLKLSEQASKQAKPNHASSYNLACITFLFLSGERERERDVAFTSEWTMTIMAIRNNTFNRTGMIRFVLMERERMRGGELESPKSQRTPDTVC